MPHFYTKNIRQQRNSESRRHSLLYGRTHQFVIWFQMVKSENIHKCGYISLYLVIYIYTCKHIHVTTIDEKEIMNLKEQGEAYERFWREKREGTTNVIILHSQK